MRGEDTAQIVDLKSAMTPAAMVEQLAQAGISISERKLRDLARTLGACRIIGNKMFLMPEDVQSILDAAKPAPKPVAVLRDSDYGRLLKLRAKLASEIKAPGKR